MTDIVLVCACVCAFTYFNYTMHGRHLGLRVTYRAHTRLANYSYEFKFNLSVPKVQAEGTIENRLQSV